ncbi:mannose-1-phosphate guanylyltransferase/mannose-6-phosphate isomerase [Thalassobaculum sp.]|uniref:mannose-1-phosphate guanylyltransferase/mannose-6-phosphate isomerase n=1 Tax=Thalassobaculum sp. TaxID=2022740 RepID=UPI0032ED575A
MSAGNRIVPVILCGGAGTRLWPLSRAQYPKQFLSLVGDASMLQATAQRVADPTRFAPPVVVANVEHRFLVAEQLRAIDIQPRAILLEAEGRNSAPAATLAAHRVMADEPATLILLLAADHAMSRPGAFVDAIDLASPAALAGRIVTFGIRPDRPETGYGYIRAGDELPDLPGVHSVDRFVEKPDAPTASRYLADGRYVWNSGNFLTRADTLAGEVDRLAPAIGAAARATLAGTVRDLDYERLDPEAFAQAPAISLDYAVMEKTDRAAVVPCDPEWSDVGSFATLRALGGRDAAGNVASGDTVAIDTRDCLIRSTGPLVATLGVADLVIVATPDAVLIADAARAQDVKTVVDRLRVDGRTEADGHPEVHRPWGSYSTLDRGPGFQVKQIRVHPGGRLSLQSHRHRAEHWVVIEGTARVTRGPNRETLETVDLGKNRSIDIPLGWVHRLENPTDAPVAIIEVQSGGYLGEDDIERYDDAYGRG